MKHDGKNYIYGTAAKKIEYDVYEENKVLKKKKQQRVSGKARLKVVLTILVIFAASLLLMYRYALITELNYKVSDLEKTYTKIKNENSVLRVEIENEMSLSKVKEIAEVRLGMQSPDRYQKVYIRVPKSDVTKVADKYREEKKGNDNLIAILMNKVGKLTGLIY
jgi:cell division protein FtsL